MITDEKVYLDETNFYEIKNLIMANDEGSREVAYTIINNLEYESNKIFILCLLKSLNADNLYPDSEKIQNILNTIRNIDGITIEQINFKEIFNLAKPRNKENEISFLLNMFKNELEKVIQTFGYSFLEYLDIEVKIKNI